MRELLNFIRDNRKEHSNKMIENIIEYKYRDMRYKTDFAMMLIYVENIVYTKEVFENSLRLTDKHIELTPHMHAVVLDAVSAKSYLKAAENIQYALQKHQKNNFYISAVESIEYKNDYNAMIKDLFDLLEYAVENNFQNYVVDNLSDI